MADSKTMVKTMTQLAREYFGGITHAHTVLSNHTGHRESDLTIDRIVATLAEAGLVRDSDAPLEYIMLNEHPSDPAKPRRLGRFSPRGRRLLRQRRRPAVGTVPVLYGLEVSLLPNGQTDLTPRLNDNCALVIASRHALPHDIEHDATAITELFEAGCNSPTVGVLGHPPRYIETHTDIDWQHIFNLAAQTGTAIEINMNSFPDDKGDVIQFEFWDRWLKLLAESKAPIFIGTDLHNQYQLNTFIYEWQHLGEDLDHYSHLDAFIRALDRAGVRPEQVVTANFERLMKWLALDKAGRAQLLLSTIKDKN
jgi:histidinol phosphatase-like PHP family hydrolase